MQVLENCHLLRTAMYSSSLHNMQHCSYPPETHSLHRPYVAEVPLTSKPLRRECSVRPSLRPAVWHGRPDECTAERSRRTGYCSLLLPVACCHRGVHCTLQLESSDASDASDPSDPRSGPAVEEEGQLSVFECS